ncbi:MAG: deoxyribonuclease IV [Syntrophales bacterium]
MMLGAHMSIAGGIEKSILRGLSIGCEAIQIFTKSTNQWQAKPLTTEGIELFKKHRGISDIFVLGHTSYLINLASPDEDLWLKSVASFITEIERCALLGILYLVAHPGAHVGSGETAGLTRINQGLDRICDATKESKVMVLLETTAGQGSALGFRFEHLKEIIINCKYPARLGVCFDTCHAFAAGYDFRTFNTFEKTFAQFDELVGIEQIKAIHLNDSRGGLASHLDRHEHIGQGRLGLKAFRLLLNDSRFQNLPFLLETPTGKDLKEDVQNLDTVRNLIGSTG